MPMRRPTRRQFLAGVGSAAVGTVALSGAASADHGDAMPAHVTLTYDQQRLHKYRPLLDIQTADQRKLLGLYGWIASSPEHETDVMVYWASYTHQDAPFWAPGTGHYGDHEPVQVEVDADTGEVVRVRASIYHWIKGEATPAARLPMDGTNPRLKVVNPWHQYTAAAPEASVQAFEVHDLRGEWAAWLDNGLESASVPGNSRNPWVMRREPDWWRRGSFGLPASEVVRLRFARSLGFGTVGSLTR